MNGLRYIRKECMNKTMDEVAVELCVTKQAVYLWETERKKIPLLRLEQLSILSGIPTEYFLKEELTDEDKLKIKYLDSKHQMKEMEKLLSK